LISCAKSKTMNNRLFCVAGDRVLAFQRLKGCRNWRANWSCMTTERDNNNCQKGGC